MRFLLFPALAMSLGWGLRGFIGGGPLGAMIPGALVALALCLLLERDGDDAGRVAAWGAIGVGFGGQMTYGQTIGLAFQPDTAWWGLLGLALKGAIWGLLGGAVIGLVLDRDSVPTQRLRNGLALMVLATYAGWKLLNEPKLVYFSNRLDRPRPEIWFGLMLGAVALLVVARNPVARRFALYGAVGGGFGFGVGGWIQVLGRSYAPTPWVGWWKVMELFFGFWFGWALGACARRHRELLRKSVPGPSITSPVAVALVALALWAIPHVPSRFAYTIVGAALMALALESAAVAWQLAITMTYCAFSIDYLRSRPPDAAPWLWLGVGVTTAAMAWCVSRRGAALTMFLALLWTANVNSYLKSFTSGWVWNGHTLVEIAFTMLGVACTWLALRISEQPLSLPGSTARQPSPPLPQAPAPHLPA